MTDDTTLLAMSKRSATTANEPTSKCNRNGTLLPSVTDRMRKLGPFGHGQSLPDSDTQREDRAGGFSVQ